MFEVQDLKFATLATVSRCGMVWFSEDVLSTEMIFDNFLLKLKHVPLEEGEEEMRGKAKDEQISPTLMVTNSFLQIICNLLILVTFLISYFFYSYIYDGN